jgi:hypothetical protein
MRPVQYILDACAYRSRRSNTFNKRRGLGFVFFACLVINFCCKYMLFYLTTLYIRQTRTVEKLFGTRAWLTTMQPKEGDGEILKKNHPHPLSWVERLQLRLRNVLLKFDKIYS